MPLYELQPTDLTSAEVTTWRKGYEEARKITPLGYLGDPASARAEGRRYFEPRLTVDPSGEHR